MANYLKNKKIENYHLQMRIQGFLSERFSNIFYAKNFAASRIKKIPMLYVNNKTKINLAIIKENLKPAKIKKKSVRKIIIFFNFVFIIIFFIFCFIFKLKKIIFWKKRKSLYTKLRKRKQHRKKKFKRKILYKK